MVAVSKTLMVSSSNDMIDSGKCRYKTGKCLNDRSFKRNGQFHQLCMFHREKANRIQRKFDRQKRSVAKENKTGGSHHKNGKVDTTMSGRSFGAHRDCGEFFSDTDSYDGRLSVDSCDGIFKDDLWSSSSSPMSDYGMSIKLEHVCDPEPVPVNSPVTHQGRLSVDEIDFLCSAMF
ncbi:hypothetical protein H310_00535 [Aphanomyces invadans]|nr:hypothetical protein H310_00535 [Aphanomyces invadans]ETW10165.1 hypothetical protein H310_00535 [Aphanomyces invadans]|eukprot:XP_008861576.1 hypothetical protein H310_00535 [Aphanomyces invadans]